MGADARAPALAVRPRGSLLLTSFDSMLLIPHASPASGRCLREPAGPLLPRLSVIVIVHNHPGGGRFQRGTSSWCFSTGSRPPSLAATSPASSPSSCYKGAALGRPADTLARLLPVRGLPTQSSSCLPMYLVGPSLEGRAATYIRHRSRLAPSWPFQRCVPWQVAKMHYLQPYSSRLV
jgi:hypothetical protein